MKFPHPIRRFKAALADARQLLVQLIYTANHLAAVVVENTRLNSELISIKESVQYLERAERHSRQESGRRADF
jgi:hypothetical protein